MYLREPSELWWRQGSFLFKHNFHFFCQIWHCVVGICPILVCVVAVMYLKEAEPLVQTSSEQQLAGRVKLHRLHHRFAGLLLIGISQPGSLNQPWGQLLVLAQKCPCP